jgi:hypothetical protein
MGEEVKGVSMDQTMKEAFLDELTKIASSVGDTIKRVGKHVAEHGGHAASGWIGNRITPAADVVTGIAKGDTHQIAKGVGGAASLAGAIHAGATHERSKEKAKK